MAISLVGSVGGANNNGGNVVLTLPVGITENDVCYVAGSQGATSNLTMSMVTVGYTTLADVYANDSIDANLGVFRKIQGPTPDTDATFNGTAGIDDGVSAVVMVLRGVDLTTPEDATTTTTSGINGPTPDPPSITTVTNNAWVLAIGASTERDAPVVPTNYTDFIFQASTVEANPTVTMMARRLITPAGAENPGSFTGIAGDGNDSWCAASVAVRPGVTEILAEASITEADDTVASTGVIALRASAAITEANDTLSTTGKLAIVATASLTEANDTVTSAGNLLVAATLAVTEGDDVISADGVLPVVATASITEDDDTILAEGVGVISTTGVANITEQDDTLTSTSELKIAAVASIVELDDILSSTSSVAIKGALSVTESDDVVAAFGGVPKYTRAILLCGI